MEDAFLAALGKNRDTERLVIHLDGAGRIDVVSALATVCPPEPLGR